MTPSEWAIDTRPQWIFSFVTVIAGFLPCANASCLGSERLLHVQKQIFSLWFSHFYCYCCNLAISSLTLTRAPSKMRRTKQKRVKNPSKFVANVWDLFTWVCSQGSNCVCRAALVLAHASVKVVLAQIFQYMDHRFVIFSVQSWLQTSPYLHPNVWLQTPSVPVCVHECTLSIFLHITRLPSKKCWNAVTFPLPNHPIKSACTVSTWHFLHVSCCAVSYTY